ncbi:hypothetical protein [Roseovarius halotolerans]|uniref:hypothetical protein n=1 Tax=Roseovarius halotolerans TaxID=505353 RepID=UPI000A269D0D|nr:hypothetical protein [Roseovarius halotolerans]
MMTKMVRPSSSEELGSREAGGKQMIETAGKDMSSGPPAAQQRQRFKILDVPRDQTRAAVHVPRSEGPL